MIRYSRVLEEEQFVLFHTSCVVLRSSSSQAWCNLECPLGSAASALQVKTLTLFFVHCCQTLKCLNTSGYLQCHKRTSNTVRREMICFLHKVESRSLWLAATLGCMPAAREWQQDAGIWWATARYRKLD